MKRDTIINTVGISGLVSFGIGLWWWNPPASLIGVGAVMLGMAMLAAIRT